MSINIVVQKGPNFIEKIIEGDIKRGFSKNKLCFRFPPEPNGFLHIGHVKAICLNFDLGEEFGAPVNLRFDDTNPAKEEQAYIDAIKEDVSWLGFEWAGPVRFASDYFDQLYAWAQHLIREGKAYVDDLSPDEIREYRGTLTEPGKPSPYRERSAEESLDLLERMRNGEFGEGEKVLRAKIDMASPNINLRDPILYRIRHAHHHQTGDKWKIYPSYDFTHGQSDAIEGITHSICTLEFEDHRPLYEWFLNNLPVPAKPLPDGGRIGRAFARLDEAYLLPTFGRAAGQRRRSQRRVRIDGGGAVSSSRGAAVLGGCGGGGEQGLELCAASVDGTPDMHVDDDEADEGAPAQHGALERASSAAALGNAALPPLGERV